MHTVLADTLKGIRILDLSRLLPGPYCTSLLAGLGADVVKIETPLAGDYLRLIPDQMGFGKVFDALNGGKKSVAVNYRNPKGKAIVAQLIRQSDVLVEAFRPGAVTRWGLDYASASAINPRLVYCSLSAFGQTGPYTKRAAHEMVQHTDRQHRC